MMYMSWGGSVFVDVYAFSYEIYLVDYGRLNIYSRLYSFLGGDLIALYVARAEGLSVL